MQIRIEIDVKPEELRRFLGLPDVAGLQEDVIQFLREKVGAASESFDPTTFVKENFQSLRQSSAWRAIMAKATIKRSASADEETARTTAATKRPRKPAAARKPRAAQAGRPTPPASGDGEGS